MWKQYFIKFAVVSGFMLVVCLWRRRAKRFVLCVDADRCVGCGACVKRCRHKVLAVKKNEAGRGLAFAANPSQCSACGHCIKACRLKALELVNVKLRQ